MAWNVPRTAHRALRACPCDCARRDREALHARPPNGRQRMLRNAPSVLELSLEHVDESEWVDEREYRWILQFAREGADLLNANSPASWSLDCVRTSPCSDFLTEPRTSMHLRAVGFRGTIKVIGDRWFYGPLPLSEAIYWCLKMCPELLPDWLEEAVNQFSKYGTTTCVESRLPYSLNTWSIGW